LPIKCFTACSAGDIDACDTVQMMFSLGNKGLDKDEVKAGEYHARACELVLEDRDGDAKKRCLGAFLDFTVKTKNDERAAIILRGICADPKLDDDCQLALNVAQDHKSGPLHEAARAIAEAACAKGDVRACERLKKLK
jgi:TPR repeat protein